MLSNTSSSRNKPTTVKGAWNAAKRMQDSLTHDGIRARIGSLREFARNLAQNDTHGLGAEAKRWLDSKRSGGTDEQRAERKHRRKERQARNGMAKAAKKGKGNLKPSGEGKKDKKR